MHIETIKSLFVAWRAHSWRLVFNCQNIAISSFTTHDSSHKNIWVHFPWEYVHCQTTSQSFICDPCLLPHKYLSSFYIGVFAGYHCQNNAKHIICDPRILPQKCPSSVSIGVTQVPAVKFTSETHRVCLEAPLSSLLSFIYLINQHVSKHLTSTREYRHRLLLYCRGPKGYYASGRTPCGALLSCLSTSYWSRYSRVVENFDTHWLSKWRKNCNCFYRQQIRSCLNKRHDVDG